MSGQRAYLREVVDRQELEEATAVVLEPLVAKVLGMLKTGQALDVLILLDDDGAFLATLECHLDEALTGLPDVIVADLLARDEAFALHMAWCWQFADAEDRDGILAFHDGGGPEAVRQVKLRHEDGTPTAEELRRMVEGT